MQNSTFPHGDVSKAVCKQSVERIADLPAARKRLTTGQQEFLRQALVVRAHLVDLIAHELCDILNVGDACVAYTGCQMVRPKSRVEAEGEFSWCYILTKLSWKRGAHVKHPVMVGIFLDGLIQSVESRVSVLAMDSSCVGFDLREERRVLLPRLIDLIFRLAEVAAKPTNLFEGLVQSE